MSVVIVSITVFILLVTLMTIIVCYAFEELRAIAYDIVVHSSSYDDCFELSDPDFLRCTVKSVMLDLLHLSSCVFFDDDVLPPADQII